MAALFSIHLLSFILAVVGISSMQIPLKEPAVMGRYTNPNYRFSVTVPDSVHAFGTAPPAPNHGFGINLSQTPHSYLWVDGSFFVYDYTEQDLGRELIRSLESRGATKARITKHEQTRMGVQRAHHFIIRYELKGVPMMSEILWALRPTGEPVDIVYSINLECAEERFKEDSKVVEALRRTWRID